MFCRVADHERGYALVARDDGVVYRLDGGPAGAELPHDLVHFTVEDALGMPDGIWGAIAGGAVFRSMTHVSGRRPPHAADRSAELIRVHRPSLQRAELIGGFVERIAEASAGASRGLGDADLHKAMRESFATQPDLVLDVRGVRRAVYSLLAAAERWRGVAVGGQLTCHWPGYRRLVPPMAARNRRNRRGRVTPSETPSEAPREATTSGK